MLKSKHLGERWRWLELMYLSFRRATVPCLKTADWLIMGRSRRLLTIKARVLWLPVHSSAQEQLGGATTEQAVFYAYAAMAAL
jgi:hypothetical protein